MRFPFPLSRMWLVAALACVMGAGAAGQDPPRRPRPGQETGGGNPGRPPRDNDDGPGEPPPPPPLNRLFEAIDLDQDGELSSKEIARAAESIAKLDRNKDGIISEDEVRPPPPPGGPRGPGGPGGPGGPPQDPKALVESVMRYDKDGDGKVTAKELPERMARMIEQGDTNKDGALQKSEVEALSRRPSPRRPGPPGGGPPGSPPGPPENDEDGGRPVEAVARELGVTPEKFREVFRKVRPAARGQRPTEAQRQQNRKVLSEGLGVSPERLDEVMDKYRPEGRIGDGPR